VFFSYALIIAVLELVVSVVKTYVLLPRLEQPLPLRFDVKPLFPILRFSVSISFLSVVWVLVTQVDKLILSKLLNLSEYGLFTLAAAAASGLMVLANPISNAVQPRFARLHAEGNETELIALYRKATQFVSIMVFPVAMVLVFFAKPVIWIWTNDPGVADKIAAVFALYVLGNALLAIAAFAYYLQFAKGDMRLNLYGNVLFLVVQVPSTALATVKYGMIGAGCAWLIARAMFLLLWVPIVHRRFAKGIHLKWLVHDVGYPLLSSMAAALALSLVIPSIPNRTSMAALIGLSGILVVSCAVLSSGESRRWAIAAARALDLFGRKVPE
jgi:O-antigen/teichoic acid export membrane protein